MVRQGGGSSLAHVIYSLRCVLSGFSLWRYIVRSPVLGMRMHWALRMVGGVF